MQESEDKRGGRPSTLTDKQKDEIGAMRENTSLTIPEIAKLVKATVGAVEWFCLVEGVDGRDDHRKRQLCQRKTYIRKGVTIRPYTANEDRQLVELALKHRPADVARLMNRKPNSVQARLATIARWENRNDQLNGEGLK